MLRKHQNTEARPYFHPTQKISVMSGAEALVVLGILANIFAVVDFSSKAIERVKESLEDTGDLPVAFQRLQNSLPLMSDTLRKTEQKAKAGEFEESTCKALQPVIADYNRKLEDLKGILKKLVPPEGASKWRRGMSAISSLGYDRKVEGIVKALESSMSLLTHYHVATAPTAAQLTTLAIRTPSAATKATPERPSIPRPYYEVPIVWSDDFTGRVEIMETLGTQLCQTNRHSRVALVGLGGVGKTRIALQFADQLKGYKEVSVFWMHASNLERLKMSCSNIAKTVNLIGWDDPKVDIFQLVKDWFEKGNSGKWLLVIDNADDMEMFYGSGQSKSARYFPRSNHGSILMTTRYRKIGLRFATARNSISVPALSLAESKQLLNARLGVARQEDDDLTQLAEELENIPLALVQASSFIAANETSVGRYLQLYGNNEVSKIQLLSEDFEDDTRDPEIKNPVATTWAISFSYIEEHDREAAEILSMISMLDAQAIPESLLFHSGDSLRSEKSVGTLKAFSLITLREAGTSFDRQQERAYDLHRLVRLAMRSWLRMHDTFKLWTALAMGSLVHRYVPDLDDTRATWAKYLPHAMKVLSSDQLLFEQDMSAVPQASRCRQLTLPIAPWSRSYYPTTAQLLFCVARSLHTDANYDFALMAAHRALFISQLTHGDTFFVSQEIRVFLAKILFESGDYARTERFARQFISDTQATYGPVHTATLMIRSNLARALHEQGRLDETISIRNEIIAECTEVLGPEHPETLIAMSEMADVYAKINRYEEAYALALKAMDLYDKVDGNGEHRVCRGMCYLTFAFYTMGYLAESEKICTQWYAISQSRHGKKSLRTIKSMVHLARIYTRQERWDKAIQARVDLLETRMEVQGQRHPSVINEICQLAEVYCCQSRFVEMEKLYKDILESTKELPLPNRARYLENMMYSTTLRQESSSEARTNEGNNLTLLKMAELLMRMIQSRRELFRDEMDHDTATATCSLGRIHYCHHRYDEAEELARSALPFVELEDSFPLRLNLTWILMISMTASMEQMVKRGQMPERERIAEAYRLAISAVDLSEKVLGKNDPISLTYQHLYRIVCVTLRDIIEPDPHRANSSGDTQNINEGHSEGLGLYIKSIDESIEPTEKGTEKLDEATAASREPASAE